MEEENELLRFIRNYNGDFYYDFPVVLELICKEDRKEVRAMRTKLLFSTAVESKKEKIDILDHQK